MTARIQHAADSLHIWLDNAGRLDLLERDETILLGRTVQSWQKGEASEKEGRKALNKLIRHNLRLVASVWKKQFTFVRASDPRAADLLQEGCFGLRTAAMKWDPERGYTFATYAVNWIRKDMGQYLRDKDRTIRLSADCYAVVNMANKFIDQTIAATGERPSLEQIAEKCKKKPQAVKQFLELYQRANAKTSLDQPVKGGDDDQFSIGDMTIARAEYDMAFDKRTEKLGRIIEILMESAGLSHEEKVLVRERSLYSSEPRSFTVIADELGIKGTQARPTYLRAMARLEDAAKASGMTVTGILCRA